MADNDSGIYVVDPAVQSDNFSVPRSNSLQCHSSPESGSPAATSLSTSCLQCLSTFLPLKIVDNHILVGSLCDESGNYLDSQIDLDQIIGNDDGTFIYAYLTLIYQSQCTFTNP